MSRSDELLLPRVPQWRCTYELKHCLSDILLRHSILQLRSVVIFDNFVVLVARFFWFFRILAYYYVLNLIGVYNSWVYCVGLGARSVVFFLSGSLYVWRSPLQYSGYSLEMSLVFGARLYWGVNVTFHGIQDSAGILYH